MKKFHLSVPRRLPIFIALCLSIPAFYLILTGPSAAYRMAGSILYVASAALLAIDLWRSGAGRFSLLRKFVCLDGVILLGLAASAWPTSLPWSIAEWVLRLALCVLVFFRLIVFSIQWIAPHRLVLVFVAAVVLWALAGAGFYWLDPSVSSYEDGLWLAFTTGATVGYGDLVPSSPASRIFAVFMVLLGFALFSVVTASIAALFVGEDEKRIERELHADIRLLRAEVIALRADLASLKRSGPLECGPENKSK